MEKYDFGTYADREGPDQQSAQSDLGLHCPLIESLDVVEHIDV